MTDVISVIFWLDILNILFPLIIAVVALYTYFTIEKDNDKLLLGIGFLFLVIAGLSASLITDGFTDLISENEVIYYHSIFYFIGYLLVFIMVKPWELLKELLKKEEV